jgi:hypothetical protein
MPLVQLSYCSKMAIRPDAIDFNLAQLLDYASARNKLSHITGCLAWCGNWFIQIIEGEPAAVEETFSRIAKDSRHHDIKVLARRDIRGRSFPDWNMAGANLMEQSPHFLQAHGIGPDFDPSKILSAQVLLILMAIADLKRMNP